MELCVAEKCNLQRGMNFKLRGLYSVILMSIRVGAPYHDVISDDGTVLIYEGHDINKTPGGLDPKTVDQPRTSIGGKLTQNGLFEKSAHDYLAGKMDSEKVRVYEKIKAGIWVYNGTFRLTNSQYIHTGERSVFKFRLELAEDAAVGTQVNLDHDRMIPSHVKMEVWKRDFGQCVTCGSSENLHFDHIIPYSKGGSSKTSKNIQLLCAKHNLAKSAHIDR